MKPKILIVEDCVLLAMDLAELVQRDLEAEAVMAMNIKDALRAANDNVTLAFLDIELPDGESYPIARTLMTMGVPFIFISANESASLPDDLTEVPFLPKPVVPSRLIGLAKALVES
ncbi:MAG TPA: response regulator [Aestuariivirga sp.]|nr:response regulator [Aestuariivirga sp.]